MVTCKKTSRGGENVLGTTLSAVTARSTLTTPESPRHHQITPRGKESASATSGTYKIILNAAPVQTSSPEEKLD
jgi:hypothetical protein